MSDNGGLSLVPWDNISFNWWFKKKKKKKHGALHRREGSGDAHGPGWKKSGAALKINE